MDEFRIAPARLEDVVARIYEAAGLPAGAAALAAAQTVDAEVRGVASHGCVRVGVFVERLRRGTVNPRPDVRTIVELPGWTLLDGDRGMAVVAGRRAMELATTKARANGIAAVGVRRVSHTGHVGYFAAMALAHGMIGVVASSAAANMAPSGGADRLVGNNPIAFAIPSTQPFPLVFDMATSKVARGWVLLAAKTGEPIPAGWALDADGNPTTDAARAVAGTMLPLGDHKGYGLALVLGFLTNALTGNAPEDEPLDWLATDRDFLLSMFCVAIDPASCLGAGYASAVDAVVGHVKGSRVAPGADEVRIPGEGAARRTAEARARGIVLPAALAREIDVIAASLGVEGLA